MFTKKDLKVGYIVEDRDGGLGLLMIIECGELELRGTTVDIDELEDDLTTENDWSSGDDVVTVYGYPSKREDVAKISKENRPLLWERKEEPLEITIDEIAKWKGVPSERIRIKE